MGAWRGALICLGCYNKVLQTGQVKQQKLISHGSGDWEVQVRGINLLSDEVLFSCSQTAIFSLCPHMVEGVGKLFGVSCIKPLILLMRAAFS